MKSLHIINFIFLLSLIFSGCSSKENTDETKYIISESDLNTLRSNMENDFDNPQALDLFIESRKLISEGEILKSIDKLNEAYSIEKGKGRSLIYIDRGVNYMRLNQYSKAHFEFDQLIQFSPNWAEGYINRGYLYFLENKNIEALKDFNKAISLDSSIANSYSNRGLVKFKLYGECSPCEDFSKARDLATINNQPKEAIDLINELYDSYCSNCK